MWTQFNDMLTGELLAEAKAFSNLGVAVTRSPSRVTTVRQCFTAKGYKRNQNNTYSQKDTINWTADSLASFSKTRQEREETPVT